MRSMIIPTSLVVWLGVMGLVRADDWSTLYGAARADARQVSGVSLSMPLEKKQWQASVDERREQWREMLGLSPLPPRTPLEATVTGTLDRGDYVIEKVHFQSVPGAYVIGNLYRPAKVEGRLPAVLYLCGHSQGKVNPRYQAHPRWFGTHGYVALVLDPIQLGESQGFHHGTYRGERWDWPSRGYTPAGTEVWNAMRALDYLETRDDVDADRMGVTGLSGGGVISWCLGAADERVKVVAPVCQSGSIEQVVTDRGTDGHCDCAFWINYYRWCWSDVGSLIAPRALLISAGSEDVLWRPHGYRDVAERIRRQYRALGADESFDIVEDISPHGYTPKLRREIFTWFNTHLKDDDTPVVDDISEYVEPEENLLVFEGSPPVDDRMQRIDELLVPVGEAPELSDVETWKQHQQQALQRLRQTTFRNLRAPTGSGPRSRDFRTDGSAGSVTYGTYEFSTPDGMGISIRTRQALDTQPPATIFFALPYEATKSFTGGSSYRPSFAEPYATAAVEVRGTGATSVGPGYLWTAKRTYPILGQTLPERQVSDLLSAIEVLRAQQPTGKIAVYGEGETALLALYAGVLCDEVNEIVLQGCPASHTDPSTSEFLGVLRVGDVPHNLALAFPKTITFIGEVPAELEWVRDVYQRFDAGDNFRTIPRASSWQPQ